MVAPDVEIEDGKGKLSFLLSFSACLLSISCNQGQFTSNENITFIDGSADFIII